MDLNHLLTLLILKYTLYDMLMVLLSGLKTHSIVNDVSRGRTFKTIWAIDHRDNDEKHVDVMELLIGTDDFNDFVFIFAMKLAICSINI